MNNNENNIKGSSSAPHAGEAHSELSSFSGRQTRARRVKSRRKALKITLVSLIAFLLIVTTTLTAVVLPILKDINNSIVDVPFITPPANQTFPDAPPGSFIPDTSGEMNSDTEWPTETPEISTEELPPVGGDKTPVSAEGIYKVEQKDPDVENILVIGTDSRNLSSLKGRSDTMMVCSYNRRTGKAVLISLLRDALVYIDGYGWNRLNATFSFGGVALCINTINRVFDLDIQRFVIVNFEGTQNLVDACGGVDMRLTDTGPDGRTNEVFYIQAYKGGITKNPDGTYHLDGKAALIHMRHRWGSSDYKRTERQRNVIMALFRQVVSSRDLSEIYGIVRQGFGMIATNIPLSEMIDLAASVVGNGANMSISSQRISGSYATFIIGEQRYANPGESGASVISINQTYMASEISKWIYGK